MNCSNRLMTSTSSTTPRSSAAFTISRMLRRLWSLKRLLSSCPGGSVAGQVECTVPQMVPPPMSPTASIIRRM